MTSAYLDHAAATPMRPEALAVLAEVAARVPGNPSGQHRWAREARRTLDGARDQIADVLGVAPGEVVLTSGGTEADNLAVAGAPEGAAVCLATDHAAVREPVLARGGVLSPVGSDGVVGLEALGDLLGELGTVSVVSVAAVNSELGIVQRTDEVAEVVRRRAPGALVHVDAVAAANWSDLRPIAEVADLISVSGHKVGGPKGVGALIVRSGAELRPLLRGGSQERGRRAGTPDVAGAAAFGAALAAADRDRPAAAARAEAQRDRLAAVLHEGLGDALEWTVGRPGAPDDRRDRAANIVHLLVRDLPREAVLFRLDEHGVAASGGSSCASGALEPSHVVRALGIDDELARGSLRFSVGWCTTDDELDWAARTVVDAVRELLDGMAEVAS